MNRDYSFPNNADADITARWTNEAGDPYELDAAWFAIKRLATDTVARVEYDFSTLVYDNTDKWITALVPEETMATLAPGEYRYDFVVRREVDQKVYPLLGGSFTVTKGIANVVQ